MKAIVTGGAGFIGSHIAEALCEKGAHVIVLDNLKLGSEANLSWRRNGHALDFIEGDVRDEKLGRDLVRGCDWVFHQAALPSVPLSVAQPWETNEQTLTAALQWLILARDAGVKRFLFASSSAVYGDNPVSPKHERLAPDPLSPYALQKYAAEKYGQLFHQLYGLETVSLRYFNVFGPRQSFDSPYSGVIAKFCTLALEGQGPVIFGDGLQSRDFVYVSNVARSALIAAEAPAERVAGKVFNIAGGASVTLIELLGELNRLTGRELKPEFQPARAGDVRHSEADITAAREGFGYEVTVSWQEGLERTLEFYRGDARGGTGEIPERGSRR